MEKKRKPWLSASLSGVEPGLGQLYNGNIFLSVLFGSIAVIFYGFAVLWLLASFSGLLAAIAFATVFSLYAVFQAWRESKRLGVMTLKRCQKKRYYLLFIVLVTCTPEVLGFVMPNSDRFATFSIPSGSMLPTLLVGDYVMADSWAFAKREPERGEVIVFLYPKDHDTHYVKRLVGLPGDIIEMKEGTLFVNHEQIKDVASGEVRDGDGFPYRLFTETIGNHQFTIRKIASDAIVKKDTFGPITVPPGSYFALGDNRDRSSDSRYWGYIAKNELVGKMLYLYFSFDKENLKPRLERLGTTIN